jgi:hypothetical protein
VRAADQKLSRAFSAAVVQTALAGYPGLYFTEPPGAGTAVTEFWPTLLPATEVRQEVVLDDRRWDIPPTPPAPPVTIPPPAVPAAPPATDTTRVPLGTLVGARSGDKAGNATLGLWTRDDAAYAWLRDWLTDDRLRALLPEAAGCDLRRWELPRLRAVGFTLVGYLGHGVAGNLHLDVQAKGLAEYLRAKHADLPTTLL